MTTPYSTGRWAVCAVVEYGGKNPAGSSVFPAGNPTGLTKGTAERIAELRNKAERIAGNTHITWFPSEQLDFTKLIGALK